MDREELIRVLREAYEKDGYAGLRPYIDDMIENGPMHDPEWLVCSDCGDEYQEAGHTSEHHGSGARSHPLCDGCALYWRLIRESKYEYRDRPRRRWYG